MAIRGTTLEEKLILQELYMFEECAPDEEYKHLII
jgi:hypothetical protein